MLKAIFFIFIASVASISIIGLQHVNAQTPYEKSVENCGDPNEVGIPESVKSERLDCTFNDFVKFYDSDNNVGNDQVTDESQLDNPQQIQGSVMNITDINIIENSDTYSPKTIVLGKVQNNGVTTLSLVNVIIELYDNQGNLIGLETTYTNPSSIEPNHSSSFKFEITDQDVNRDLWTDFLLKADGRY